MAGELADEVRVFDLFVEVAYKGSVMVQKVVGN